MSLLLGTPFAVTEPAAILGANTSCPNMTFRARNEDLSTDIISIVFTVGTVTSSAGIDQSFAWSTNPQAPSFTLALNESTGVWTFSSNTAGQMASGTLTGTQLTAAIAAFHGAITALRDFADYFVLTSIPEIPCTQPTLWGSGDA